MGKVNRTPPPETSTQNMAEANIRELDINDLRRGFAEQQRVIQQLQTQQQSQLNQTINQGVGINEGTLGNFLQFSIRDALEAVPSFDGENISFVYFVEGCEEALSMISPAQEIILVRAIRNKLKGDAHRSILGKTFNNLQELVEFLRIKYGPRETVYEAQGRLAYIYQKKDEKVTAYANRIRELGKRILDAHKRETGGISQEFRNSIDQHLKTSFLRGLNREIIISKEGTFEEIESRAIDAEKEIETINMIRSVINAESKFSPKNALVHRMEAQIEICQFCNKKGHTAKQCRQIKFQNNNYANQNSLQSYSFKPNSVPNSRNNSFNSNNRNESQQINGQAFGNQNFVNQTVMCRYCKKQGHKIEECRKRIYNNNLRQNAQVQGNEFVPERTGAISGKNNIRPTQTITVENE